METLVGVAMLGTPFVAVAVLLALLNRRQRRRQEEVGRQIALTDAIHARVGAVVAPEVRRREGRWEVAIAAPLESPPLVAEVLAIVEQAFAGSGAAPYEVVLRRQRAPAPRARAGHPGAVRRESLSWT